MNNKNMNLFNFLIILYNTISVLIYGYSILSIIILAFNLFMTINEMKNNNNNSLVKISLALEIITAIAIIISFIN